MEISCFTACGPRGEQEKVFPCSIINKYYFCSREHRNRGGNGRGCNMRFDGKQLAKLALIFFGLLFIVCLFLGRRQGQEKTPPLVGERITVEDVAILMDALGVSFPIPESGAEGQMRSMQDAGEKENAAYFTYGQYQALCESIAEEEWGLPDYGERYEAGQALLKEDWYRAFRILLAHLDTESSIWETTVFVLRVDEEAAEAYTENGAMQGACHYCSAAFAENELQEMKVYIIVRALQKLLEMTKNSLQKR